MAPRHRPGRGKQPGIGTQIGQILNDRGTLRQRSAVLQTQHGHIAIAVDAKEILAFRSPMGLAVDLDELDGKIELPADDMR